MSKKTETINLNSDRYNPVENPCSSSDNCLEVTDKVLYRLNISVWYMYCLSLFTVTQSWWYNVVVVVVVAQPWWYVMVVDWWCK